MPTLSGGHACRVHAKVPPPSGRLRCRCSGVVTPRRFHCTPRTQGALRSSSPRPPKTARADRTKSSPSRPLVSAGVVGPCVQWRWRTVAAAVVAVSCFAFRVGGALPCVLCPGVVALPCGCVCLGSLACRVPGRVVRCLRFVAGGRRWCLACLLRRVRPLRFGCRCPLSGRVAVCVCVGFGWPACLRAGVCRRFSRCRSRRCLFVLAGGRVGCCGFGVRCLAGCFLVGWPRVVGADPLRFSLPVAFLRRVLFFRLKSLKRTAKSLRPLREKSGRFAILGRNSPRGNFEWNGRQKAGRGKNNTPQKSS